MTITTKTRKILWGRSANRCAICKRELVADSSKTTDYCVIGEECHILARSPGGPRADRDAVDLDSYENLILLCRNHHKIVDDQANEYPPERLRHLKTEHEEWVRQVLSTTSTKPVKISVNQKGRSEPLVMLTNGQQIVGIIGGSDAYQFSHDHLESQKEADAVSKFFQILQDFGDLWNDFESGDRVQAAFMISEELANLLSLGLIAYGKQLRGTISGGFAHPSNWLTAQIHVFKVDNPTIRRTSPERWPNSSIQ